MASTDDLRQKREHLIAGIPAWKDIVRGTLKRYRLPCGQKRCRCHRSERYLHGPYWYVAVSGPKGKRKMTLIPGPVVPELQEAIAAYDKLWRSLCEISEVNLELVKRRGRRGR